MIKLKFSKSAVKFINNLSEKEQLKIKQKLKYLVEKIYEIDYRGSIYKK